MDYSQLRQLISNYCSPDCWLHSDAYGIWTLKADLNVTIREQKSKDESYDEFHESWARNHSNPNAVKIPYDIFYGASFVETHYFIAVDGYRAVMPMPKLNSTEIETYEYQIARSIDFLGTLDEYINRSQLSVE